MPGRPASRNLSEIERSFAESRRAAAARRRGRERRPHTRRMAKALLVAVTVFAFAGGIVAEAHGPGPHTNAAVAPAERCPIPRELRRAFLAASEETGVPLSLLAAMAHEESQMNPNARSRKGAVGLLQLMPGTARELDADPTDPTENVRAGAAYVARMLEWFGDDLDLALAAYNAGPNAVAEAEGAPSLETLAFVANVKARALDTEGCR